MFQKLRLKLTAINVSIILSLFFILIVGAYFMSRYDMDRRSTFVAQRIIADVQAGFPGPPFGGPPGGRPPGPPEPGGRPPGTHFFYVKVSPEGAVTGRSPNVLNDDDLARLAAKALADGKERGTVELAEGAYSYLQAPLNDGGGQVIVFHDLSQDREMQLALLTALMAVGAVCSLLSFGASFVMAERAMSPIRGAWQQQKDFLSDASHELRSPLAVIQTNLDVVRLRPEDTVASQEKWLDNIQEEVAYMAKLVDSLLFLARVDSAQQQLDKRPLFYDEVLLRAATPFEALADAKGVALRITVADEASGYGDEARIRQAVGILLDNAIRHTPAGGKVSVSLGVTEAQALLVVADTGEGIDPADFGKIFERFYQVDKARAKGGAGLGLAIAKYIVESHGGAITVASVPGHGATFSICLPLTKE